MSTIRSRHTLGAAAASKATNAVTPKADDGGAHPLLQHSFAAVQEKFVPYDLPVDGRIPEELKGQFVVNGPNYPLPVELPFHLFKGDGPNVAPRVTRGATLTGGR